MSRTISMLLFMLFFALTARGVYVLATTSAPDGNRQDAVQSTAYILLAIFAALTLVFGFTAVKLKRSS
jgi:cell division protein FtsW (lipid II flippase)